MKIQKLLGYSLLYKIFNVFKYLYIYIKNYMLISDVFYGEPFKNIVRQYTTLDLQKDWIGRLYAVINPNIDINGKFNVNNMIIEINGTNTNNLEQIKVWMYRQLSLIAHLFKLEGLYNYIDVEFKHVGPIIADNYLVIFDIASRKTLTYYLKRAIYQSILYVTIFIILYMYVL